MSEIDQLTARIDTLEMRFAYQDQVIEDLNRTITEQWKQIDNLTRRLANLGSAFRRPPTIQARLRHPSHRRRIIEVGWPHRQCGSFCDREVSGGPASRIFRSRTTSRRHSIKAGTSDEAAPPNA